MSVKVTDGLHAKEEALVISVLQKWKGGPLSDQLFTAFAKMIPLSGAVVTIFRKTGDNLTEVMLVPRPKGDPVWPGMLNLPGKMLRAIDYIRDDKKPVNGALERIQEDELGAIFPQKPKFAGVSLHSDDRGPLVVLVYWLKVDDNFKSSKGGLWFNVEDLKNLNSFIQSEIISINVALKEYKKEILPK